MFEVGLANDPGLSVRRSKYVRRRKAIEAEHPLASFSEMEGSGASHRAKPDNDDV